MEYIHALKKRAVKSDNEIVKLNKVIKEKDKEIEKLNVEIEMKNNKLAKFRAKNAELGQKAVSLQQQLEKLNGMSAQPKPLTVHHDLYEPNGEKKKVIVVKKKSHQ
jgi:chromosome segregation ATPase